MIQKHLQVMFDSTVIICDHSDHVTAKVDRDEPVQVIKMIIWEFFFYPPLKVEVFANQPFDVYYGDNIIS